MPKRTDRNQKEITKQLRMLGFSVALTHTIGKGFPDMIVGKKGVNLLVEIKDPLKPISQRSLTPDEEYFHDGWRGSIIIAQTVDDILKHFK